jgi:hypothetical protein
LGSSTRTTRRLARILWHLLRFKEPFNPEVFAHEEARLKRKRLVRLHTSTASLGYTFVPHP